MGIALLFLRLLLASVFAVAGIAKLADLAGSRRAVVGFGVPAALASPLGILLPLAELAVAIALIPVATAWLGATGALALLLLFAVGIAANLALGRKPDCHCFGQLQSAPVGRSTLARDGVLVAAAGFVVWQGRDYVGPSVVGWLGASSTAWLLGLVGGLVVIGLLGAQWWFLLGLLRQNGRLLARLEALEESLADAGLAPEPSENGDQSTVGLPVGSPAPGFKLRDLDGEEVTLDSLLASGAPVLLLFTDPDCGPCDDLLPEVGRWKEEQADLSVVLVSQGDPEDNRVKGREHGLERILLQEDQEVSEAYEVEGTPSAVLVLPDGTVGSPLAQGAAEVERLVSQKAEAPTRAPRKVGEPAPELKLPDLSGEDVSLADFRGKDVLVLFWDPGCGFCEEMLSDLKQWEQTRPEDVPTLLVVSTGTPEANREMGLSSTVVLDERFGAGRAFGAQGTPSAVLVDAQGNVASELAVGEPEVLELASLGQAAA